VEALRCAVLSQDGTTVENIIIADQSFAYANGAIICGTIPVAIGDCYRTGIFIETELNWRPNKQK
jgi:hypothetical protein